MDENVRKRIEIYIIRTNLNQTDGCLLNTCFIKNHQNEQNDSQHHILSST